jgi:hypothetical protein
MKHLRFVPILSVLVLAMVAAQPASAKYYNVAAYWCAANFPPTQQAPCVWQAAQGVGPYFECGPGGTKVGLCGGVCCAADQVCAGQTCATPTPTARAPTPTTARTPTKAKAAQ